MEKEKQYIEAYNNGYLLEKHKPSLLLKIINKLVPANNYLQGLFAGKKQVELEKINDQLYQIQKLRSKSIEKQISIEKRR